MLVGGWTLNWGEEKWSCLVQCLVAEWKGWCWTWVLSLFCKEREWQCQHDWLVYEVFVPRQQDWLMVQQCVVWHEWPLVAILLNLFSLLTLPHHVQPASWLCYRNSYANATQDSQDTCSPIHETLWILHFPGRSQSNTTNSQIEFHIQLVTHGQLTCIA